MYILISGDWIIIFVHLYNQFPHSPLGGSRSIPVTDNMADTNQSEIKENTFIRPSAFENAHWFVLASVVVSYTTFFGIVGYLQYFYYIKQRDKVNSIFVLKL